MLEGDGLTIHAGWIRIRGFRPTAIELPEVGLGNGLIYQDDQLLIIEIVGAVREVGRTGDDDPAVAGQRLLIAERCGPGAEFTRPHLIKFPLENGRQPGCQAPWGAYYASILDKK